MFLGYCDVFILCVAIYMFRCPFIKESLSPQHHARSERAENGLVVMSLSIFPHEPCTLLSLFCARQSITFPKHMQPESSHLVKVAICATPVATVAATALLRGALPGPSAASIRSITIGSHILGAVGVVVARSAFGAV